MKKFVTFYKNLSEGEKQYYLNQLICFNFALFFFIVLALNLNLFN